MKKRHMTFLVLVVTLAFFAGYLWQTSHRLGELTYSIQKISEPGTDAKFKIDAEYPVILGGIPVSAKLKINVDLEKWVKDSVEKSRVDFVELATDPYIADRDLGLIYVGKVTVKNDFKKLPFINVSIETYYYSGGAHGITDVSSFVYDAYTGDKMSLDNIFIGDYLTLLSILSLDALKEMDPKLETYVFAEDGTMADIKNFQTWTLEPDGIHIVFSDYQVGPYVVGRPKVVIPYSKLSPVLNTEFKKYENIQ